MVHMEGLREWVHVGGWEGAYGGIEGVGGRVHVEGLHEGVGGRVHVEGLREGMGGWEGGYGRIVWRMNVIGRRSGRRGVCMEAG